MAGSRIAAWVASVILFGFLASTLSAQISQGGVAGTVKDNSGAVVPNAHITLTNKATNVSLATQSTSSGTYVLGTVPVGTYTLKADAPGFKTYVLAGIEVHVQNIVTADVPLAIGAVSEQVSVTSEVPLLQAQDANQRPAAERSQLAFVSTAFGWHICHDRAEHGLPRSDPGKRRQPEPSRLSPQRH
jgi:hypothetical protein